MDDLLHSPRYSDLNADDAITPKPSGFWSKLHYAVAQGVHNAGSRIVRRYYKIDNVISGHKYLYPVPFLLIAGVLAAVLITGTFYTSAYKISVDGVDWGIVSDSAIFDHVVEDVEQQVSEILGENYTIPNAVTYTPTFVKRDSLTSSSLLEARLYSQVGAVTQSYVLTVNGEVIGIGEESDLNDLLDQISASYITDTTKEYSFLDEIDISYQTISANTESNLNTMLASLTSNISDAVTYTAVDGDTYSGIAAANGISLSRLYSLNPDADQDILHTGDVLTVSPAVPFLSVQTVDTITYTEDIAYSSEQVEDSTMYVGETNVVTAGINGISQITADVTSINGYEESREIVSRETVTEPVTEVIAVGTKEKPVVTSSSSSSSKTSTSAASSSSSSTSAAPAYSGTFRWPVSGTLSSKFGTRWGRSHTGIDIAAPYGTTIVAADGGTVTFAGSSGNYGNLVIIDHGNGFQTYYAHCSSITVSVGTKVSKGDAIAKVGATGNATGNHCHFEIRKNGTAVNPLNYLP